MGFDYLKLTTEKIEFTKNFTSNLIKIFTRLE